MQDNQNQNNRQEALNNLTAEQLREQANNLLNQNRPDPDEHLLPTGGNETLQDGIFQALNRTTLEATLDGGGEDQRKLIPHQHVPLYQEPNVERYHEPINPPIQENLDPMEDINGIPIPATLRDNFYAQRIGEQLPRDAMNNDIITKGQNLVANDFFNEPNLNRADADKNYGPHDVVNEAKSANLKQMYYHLLEVKPITY